MMYVWEWARGHRGRMGQALERELVKARRLSRRYSVFAFKIGLLSHP